jgi:hypothetical protein
MRGNHVQFATSRPDVVRSVRHSWLLKYWIGLLRGRPMPLCKELDAGELRPVVDSMNFYDIVRNGTAARFLIRFQGATITAAYGGDCTGKFFDTVLPDAMREATLAVYRHVVATRRPVYTISQAVDREGHPVQHERLLLPFSLEGREVDRIIAALEMVSVERKFEQQGLMRGQTAPPTYSLCATIEL